MKLGEVEEILDTTDYNGFPVVVSMESQYLVGFVLRRDLNMAIANAKSSARSATVTPVGRESPVIFTSSHAPPASAPPPSARAGQGHESGNLTLQNPYNNTYSALKPA